ncbi:MAG TPA: alpha/beta fold hydrolase [Bryobacteraceae bacterium]|nr:alpha/beta fold hydrolase [Bryobacteraceae bacterium]
MKRFEQEMVRGWLHEPAGGAGPRPAIALTHGAGSNCDAPLLKALAEKFAEAGWSALRFDLPYRQARAKGPPFPAQAARDREGIERAAQALREIADGKIFLGGHSYGGRQTTLAAAENPRLAAALLLLSYPLHPPGKPERARTDHFAKLQTPALFLHGTRDAFGSAEEIKAALKLIPARAELEIFEGAPHGLPASAARRMVDLFLQFVAI